MQNEFSNFNISSLNVTNFNASIFFYLFSQVTLKGTWTRLDREKEVQNSLSRIKIIFKPIPGFEKERGNIYVRFGNEYMGMNLLDGKYLDDKQSYIFLNLTFDNASFSNLTLSKQWYC